MSLAQTKKSVVKNPLIRVQLCQAVDVSSKRIFANRELVEMFPEAKNTLKELIADDKIMVRENKELRDNIYNRIFRKVPMQDIEIVTDLIFTLTRTDFIKHMDTTMCENNNGGYTTIIRKNLSGMARGEYAEDRLARNRKLLSLFPTRGKKSNLDFQSKIAKAKEFPIENFIQVNSSGFARCPFHAEKTGSFKLNKKQNLWYCFGGCGGGDSIAFYMKLNNCGFKEAVEKLQ